MTAVDVDQLPKAVLHDHLDGGVRLQTVLELADAIGYAALPTVDPEELGAWFHQGASGSLELYLAAFEHTVGVMQTAEGLERVAYECVVDLAGDNAVYAEIRFGPSLHMRQGLAREDVIEAVLAGLARGRRETGLSVWLIAAALRNQTDSLEVARSAVRFGGEGMVGFDLSGPEAGYPSDAHLAACRMARESGLALTIHAGEGDGVRSVWTALNRAYAQRIGHGVRIIEDTTVVDGSITDLGSVARQVLDWRIPLEVSVTSNVHTGIVDRPTAHPIRQLFDAGFRVSLNTDNRLMSDISLGSEYRQAATDLGFSIREIGAMTIDAVRAGFGPWSERRRVIGELETAYLDASAGQL